MSTSKTAALLPVAVAALALPVLPSQAAAEPTLSFSIQSNQFSKPTMAFKFAGGKYVWDQKSVTTQFKASADTHDNKLLWAGPLRVRTLGIGGSAWFDGKVPEDVKTWSQQGPITFPVSFLSVYQAGFASFCDSHGRVGSPVVKDGLSILFSATQGYYKKTKEPEEVQQDAAPDSPGNGPHASRTVNMPLTVVCGPRPASTTPRPGEVAAEKGDLRVTGVALSFGGAPTTQPNPATVCKQARLTVTLKASRAGAVRFRLSTKVGDAPLQAKAIDAWAKFDGNAHFVASYSQTVSIKKTSHVQAKAEDLVNPIGLTTPWQDVTLTCQDIGGGLAGMPGNSVPKSGEVPSKQKLGTIAPTGSRHDAKSPRAPVRQKIEPATRKTTPKTGAGPHRPLRLPLRSAS
jgi:hypothetical protein